MAASEMKLATTCWTMPACTLEECAAIAKALGIPALDVGYFYASALDKQALLADPLAVAEQVRKIGITMPNLYHLFGDTLDGRNLALPGTLDENLNDLKQALTFADAAGIASVFVLPGVVNPGQSRMDALKVSAESLKAMKALADDHTANLCFEPHVHSFAESPELALRLVEVSGVGVCLDYAHFTCLGFTQDQIDPLAQHAVHVHLRQAVPGKLQEKFAHGTLNFAAMLATLRDAGYTGYVSIEPVHQDYMNTWFDDNLTEIVALRDCFNAWNEG
ncbi:MAG: sugar phosphate isomerase/epimerase [Phyllobacteriaceae bacterium]|nr:sugar phosphate isomerase/epimerase [Phyllobacteriaceae bacterium]